MVHHDLQTVPTYFETVTFINKNVIASGKIKEVFTHRKYRYGIQKIIRKIRGIYGRNI